MTNKPDQTLPEHFKAQRGWINDPNGLVYFDGRYHLFYQHYPDGLTWGPMHWGHAVSSDLNQWQHKPIALEPDEQGMCFSGSAIVDWKDDSGLFDGQAGLIAFYTAHRDKEGFDRGYEQDQCIAYSSDSGETWTKYSNNPVLSNPGFSDFRDPKVFWHEASQHWIMCLATRQTISFYRSKNLLEWSFCSEFGQDQGAHEWHPWECPDLFELTGENDQTAWVLVVGIGMTPDIHFGSYTQYFIGDFDGMQFTNRNSADTVLLLDEGRDYYATQSWSDAPNNERLAISWFSNWRYANELPCSVSNGQMTLPRQLRLIETTDGLRVAQQFASRSEAKAIQPTDSIRLSEGKHQSTQINLNEGESVYFASDDKAYRIEIKRTEERYQISIGRSVDTDDDELNQHFSHQYSRELNLNGPLSVEWIYSEAGLEMLLADGLMSITQRSFPERP
ncbi:Levanase precursor [Marinobacterium sp. xm-a-121]|uniref:glycoside hydrolase family 32 protein n=1 Tax=unclassified Marinobacterium TaxID=2644139 RepID=UPI00156810DC|nr:MULTISPECIES: glycoside hydrolase family 32 protein [unclassified Marinobacterium]NRP38839.1 Levanase precursor [Marinobacterium sp. xm-a-121]NRP99655.1 Levanase precursor [Marinobacterium sp. xm-v-233]